jgi:hypothetical protein
MTDSTSPNRSRSDGQIRTTLPDANGGVGERRTQTAQPRVHRRNRIISSCLECRRRKLKCDRGNPCTGCVKANRQCHFISPSFDAAAQARLAEVKEKMGILEKSLEEDIVRQNRAQTKSSTFPSVPDPLRQQEAYSEEEDEDIKDLRSSVFAREDAAYYEDEEGDDDIVDLGIALGKVRITERIGGLVRPKFSDEVSSRTVLNELS